MWAASACHGPGAGHVEAARRGACRELLTMPFGHDSRKPDVEMRLCGQCHRLPAQVKPERITADDPSLVRSQPVGLMQSARYRKSGHGLSCSSCHDSHAGGPTASGYEAACLACHQGPAQPSCKVSAATGCIGCHMPRREVSPGIMMTDHWIRARHESANGPALQSGSAPQPAAQAGAHSVRFALCGAGRLKTLHRTPGKAHISVTIAYILSRWCVVLSCEGRHLTSGHRERRNDRRPGRALLPALNAEELPGRRRSGIVPDALRWPSAVAGLPVPRGKSGNAGEFPPLV